MATDGMTDAARAMVEQILATLPNGTVFTHGPNGSAVVIGPGDDAWCILVLSTGDTQEIAVGQIGDTWLEWQTGWEA